MPIPDPVVSDDKMYTVAQENSQPEQSLYEAFSQNTIDMQSNFDPAFTLDPTDLDIPAFMRHKN